MLGEERARAKIAFCADLSASPPPERACGRLELLPRGGQWGNPWPPLSGRGRNPQVSSPPPPWCAHGRPMLASPSEGGGGGGTGGAACARGRLPLPPSASLIPRGSLGGQTAGALHGAGRGALRSRGLLPRRANRPPRKSLLGLTDQGSAPSSLGWWRRGGTLGKSSPVVQTLDCGERGPGPLRRQNSQPRPASPPPA